MRTKKPALACTAVILGMAMLVTACSSGGASPESTSAASDPHPGGDVTMARQSDVESLDPVVPSDNFSIWTSGLIFDTLVVSSNDGKKLLPSLAESWKVNDAGTEYTFKLRDGVKFTNDQPVTSDDVVWSLKRAFGSDSVTYGFMDPSAVVTAPDAKTVVITVDHVFAPLLSVLALYSSAVIPKDFGGLTEEAFSTKPIGSGPYMLAEWTRGQQMKLTKNTHYWKSGQPYLNSITFTAVPNDNTRLLQLQGKQIQVDEFPAYSSVATLKQTPGIKVGLFPSSSTEFMLLNNTKAPFNDVHVRRAIAHMVDKAAMSKAIFYGLVEPATSYLNPLIKGHDPEIKSLAYDVDAAKKEMAQSTVPKGFDTTILVVSGEVDRAAVAQIMQKSLSKIGINAKIQTVDQSGKIAAFEAKNYDIGFISFTTDIMDSSQTARRADGRPGVSTAAYSYWLDSRVGPLLDGAKLTLDENKRIDMYKEVGAIVNEETPFVTMFYLPAAYAFSDKLHGFESTATGYYTLATAWLDE